jgi:predicted nucleic acid-binding protein
MNSNHEDPTSVVITETTCLIILEKISLLYLLDKLFTTVIVTPEIAKEYQSILPDWVIVLPVINKTLQNQLSLIVDTGEASAITLAGEIRVDFLVTDDWKLESCVIG